MGWSCATAAADTLEAISQGCFKMTGTSNVYAVKDNRYFFEASHTEHNDGAITGVIWRYLPNGMVCKGGTFRIEGDGKLSRGPKIFKDFISCTT